MMSSILIAGVVGGLTGVVSHLMRNNKVLVFPKRRHRPKGIYLGCLADIIFGGAAAIFAITYLDPNDMREIIAISILAGMSAENILLHNELKKSDAKKQSLAEINERLKD